MTEPNLVNVLEANLKARAEKPAVFFGANSDTFGDIARKARSICGALQAKRLEPMERVGLLLPNIPEFVYAYFGILMAGGQVVPINVMMKPGEISYLGNDSSLKYIITQSACVENVLAAKAAIASLEEVFCVGAGPEGVVPFEKLLEGTQCPRGVTPNPDDVAVVLYTSGTTGFPKGAMLTHQNLYSNAIATADTYQYTENDIIAFGMPLFHSSGQTNVMNAGFSQGAAVVLLPRFSIEGVLEAFTAHPVTVFVGVPTMYHQLLSHHEVQRLKTAHLRALIVGAAPLPGSLYHALEARFQVPITEGYGLSEAGPVVAHNPIAGTKKVGSVGLPVEGVSVRLVDEGGRELGVNKVGELVVQGPNVMLGYLNQPAATAEALKDGWLHTGDLARIDQDGYIHIVDRKKDMLLTGGFNIYPREVEEVLHMHPSISEAAVVGIPDEEKGELAAAYIILKAGAEASAQDIIDFCRSKMAVYKAPRRVFFVNHFPRNPSGKVLKRLLPSCWSRCPDASVDSIEWEGRETQYDNT